MLASALKSLSRMASCQGSAMLIALWRAEFATVVIIFSSAKRRTTGSMPWSGWILSWKLRKDCMRRLEPPKCYIGSSDGEN